MPSPKVSIIVPVYNTEKYLIRCLNSLINQTEKNIEIIIIDDKTPDNSLKIIDEYKRIDPRIKLFRHKKNRGLGYARNTGIKKANGEYILFVDSDDYIELNAVQSLYNEANNKKLDILEGDYKKVKPDKTAVYPEYNVKDIPDGNEYIAKAKNLEGVCCNKLWKRDFVIKHQLAFPLDMFFEDNVFTYNAFLKAKRVGRIILPFYNYIIRQESITTSGINERHIKSRILLAKHFEKIFLEGKNLPGNRVRFKKFIHWLIILKIDLKKYTDKDWLLINQANDFFIKMYKKYRKKIFVNPELWSVQNILFAVSHYLAIKFVLFLIKIRSK